MVDDGTDNTTRKIEVLYNDDRSFTHFQFQFYLNDTAIDVVVMYICVVIFFLGIIGNIVTMAKIICDSKYHTPTFAAIGYLALPDFFSVISYSGFYFTNVLFIRKLSKYFILFDNVIFQFFWSYVTTFFCKIFNHCSSITEQTAFNSTSSVFLFTFSVGFKRAKCMCILLHFYLHVPKI